MAKKSFSFAQTPALRRPRSRFDLSSTVLTSANVGDLVPFYVQEVYPGDTMKINSTCVSRLSSSFFKPIMDNIFIDTYWFFVPSRLVYRDFPCIFGENLNSPWAQELLYQIPTTPPTTSSSNVVQSGTVADYMGLPIGCGDSVSVLPFRAFAKIYDDWFRDQNVIAPMNIQMGNAGSRERFNSLEWGPDNYFGKLPKVAKMHDYFTSCLPAPQKGEAVDFNLKGILPVKTFSDNQFSTSDLSSFPMKFSFSSGGTFESLNYGLGLKSTLGSSTGTLGTISDPSSEVLNPVLRPSNLGVDLSGTTPFTVNDLRLAFQLQKMLERDARGGTRYCEYLASHWGVSSGDARLQRSEFLGGNRSPISVTQVSQTAPSTSTDKTPLATVSGYSLSASKSRATKGFVEHGYLIGVFCLRQFHTYSQGVAKFWKRRLRQDFYEPVFANIGEQPVFTSELYFGSQGNPVPAEQVFGYNEAWADLRYRPNITTGQMRPGVTNSLSIWHLGDNYNSAPTLNSQFIEETPVYLDRGITVGSATQNQFILDFYVNNIAFRELPTYSVPSLIDHN